MADRPILFSAQMVRALLAGTKTQTRRAVKPRKDPDYGCQMAPGEIAGDEHPERLCPYGRPGDRLWVRETWLTVNGDDTFYRADYLADPAGDRAHGVAWTPSIHMPRARSRITLEVTGVRVERLQDISEEDARAEGVERSGECNWRDYLDHPHNDFTSARRSYRSLWDSINGPGSWDANPWVWVVEFRRVAQ